MTLVVSDRRNEADGVVSLTLRAEADGRELPAWEPGAHLEVALPSGLIRHYSLCGPVEQRDRYRIAVLREANSRGGSSEVHDHVVVGTRLQVTGPRNHFRLEPADSYLFVAGGIGITPILPMIAQAEADGVPWKLVYGGRRASSMAFVDEITARAGGKVELLAEDEVGRPDLPVVLGEVATGGRVYCCGPEGLLGAVESGCAVRGLTDVLHVERFAASAVAVDDGAGSAGFEVHLARSGMTVTVPPGRSILEVVREVVPQIPSSCEEGICGTCETAVLEGAPDHRDQIMSAVERASNATMMICVGRALSDRLVLDL
ncbi:PDR/VanB family oxidoreductase [Pseudonocardia oroxyli]|nr:PDR/VanB family oxidoreductase [Pseudonocardia oroxyli]